jgi:hypothetical protein
MNAIALSCITFVCILVGALLGKFLLGRKLSTKDKGGEGTKIRGILPRMAPKTMLPS